MRCWRRRCVGPPPSGTERAGVRRDVPSCPGSRCGQSAERGAGVGRPPAGTAGGGDGGGGDAPRGRRGGGGIVAGEGGAGGGGAGGKAWQFIASIPHQRHTEDGGGGVVTASDLLTAAAGGSSPAGGARRGCGARGPRRPELDSPVSSQGGTVLRATVARAEAVFGRSHPLTLRTKTRLANAVVLHDVPGAMAIIDQVVSPRLRGPPGTAEQAVEALRRSRTSCQAEPRGGLLWW
jgi:hypothetical protein